MPKNPIRVKKSSIKNFAKDGLIVERRFTAQNKDPYAGIAWEKRTAVIKDSDGSEVFKMENVEFPKSWSQLSCDIAASKYLRQTGVPGTGYETGVRQLFHRVAKTIRDHGESEGYFCSKEDADAFEAELKYMLIHQIGAFNSPVFFNVGLYHQYGIKGQGGNWYWDADKGKSIQTEDAYSRPQASACFIQSLDDSLPSIFDLAKNEARIFKYGSGSGTNFSRIRSRYEKLSTGGSPSGLMFFLEVLDKGAGAIKSGGVARRAAKMVCLDMDHPEIIDFIQWKQREEKKVAVLIAAGYPSDFNGEAYRTVSGQNANNSVRASDGFMRALEQNGKWHTRLRTSGAVHQEFEAKKLMSAVTQAAWSCADPGLQFDGTINTWHTCPNTDKIRASNPCSEFMFLDDTACNLASLNLVKFLRPDKSFDTEAYRHAIRIFFTAQEILAALSAYPTAKIAQNSHDYRPLGLGYANLGAMLMRLGIPYDSPEGRALCGALTAILTGHAYKTSAELAKVKGPFAGFAANREPMLAVMRKHREAVEKIEARFAPVELLQAALEDWSEAVEMGEHWGYRNAQATVLAPTGTIGLLMGCDTTGIEPEFALIKIKKLAGGGTMTIANESVEAALENLGYSPAERENILAHVARTGGIEGAPGLKAEHLGVFDCANPCGSGTRFIEPMGHVRMMAAAQPFISGAISKTVNMPNKTTVQEIEKIYIESWKLGLKAISVYRDGCKLSQPLVVSTSVKGEAGAAIPPEAKTAQAVLERRWLPQRRKGFTQELKIGGQKFYLRTGEYEDGSLGEFFIDGGKPGSPLKALLNSFATSCSLALQYGTPLEELVERFIFTRFEPSGPTNHPYVKQAASIIDLVFRSLAVEYLGREDLAHVKPEKREKGSEKRNSKKSSSPAADYQPSSAINDQLGKMMGDAPLCHSCGHITVRNATCYMCVNCGNSMGCS